MFKQSQNKRHQMKEVYGVFIGQWEQFGSCMIVDWRRESGFIVGWAYIVDFEWQPKEYSTFYFLYETLKPMVFDTYWHSRNYAREIRENAPYVLT